MQVRRITQAARRADWPAAESAGSVTLTYEDRHRRRMRLTTDQGEPAFLDLGKPFPLAAGDGLMFEDGEWLEIKAADEEVIEIADPDALRLLRIAWHLGNRHVPVMILDDGKLRIRHDHVILDLLERLGATCSRGGAVFQPESGAYASHGRHSR
jgi:urease accessory protein